MKSIYCLCICSMLTCCDIERNLIEYYPDGSVKSEYEMANGKFHGVGKKYYPSGTLEQISHWDNGVREDSLVKYFPNQQINLVVSFRNGLQHGWLSEFDSSGYLVRKVFYKEGMQNGKFREYFKNGNVRKYGTFSPNDNLMIQYELYPSGEPKECLGIQNDSILYSRSYDKLGALKSVMLPISVSESDTDICFKLDFSSLGRENLFSKIHITEEGVIVPNDGDLIFDSSGNEVCIPRTQLKGEIVYGIFCEAENSTGVNVSWRPFKYILGSGKIVNRVFVFQ